MQLKKRFFITGTDTNIGKTYIALGILKKFQQQGFSTIAIKPIASGCIKTKAGLRNKDALILQEAATIKLPYSYINPIAFEEPIAPHIAAAKHNLRLDIAMINRECHPVLQKRADIFVIEGAGGLCVPLNENETMADWISHLDLMVILVVGMRLGCLNHALLTYHFILQKRIMLFGWVANCVDSTAVYLQEQITILNSIIKAPLLGIVPYQQAAEHYLNFNGSGRVIVRE